LTIILLDGSRPLTADDKRIFTAVSSKNHLIVLNKTDLPAAWKISELTAESAVLKISAKFGTGINELKEAIAAGAGVVEEENSRSVVITNMRHKIALEKALDNIKRAKENAASGTSPELTAFDLREALDNLDEITGKKVNDEILDKIFSSFCIGK